MPEKQNAQMEALPLVLVVRGLVCLAVFVAVLGLFPGYFGASNAFSQADNIEAARRAVWYPKELDRFGGMYGYQALHLLLLLAVWEFLRGAAEYFNAVIGRETETAGISRIAGLCYLGFGFIEGGAALFLLHRIAGGDWLSSVAWVLRLAWLGKSIALAVAVFCLGSLYWRAWRARREWLVQGQLREVSRMVFFLRVPLLITFALGLVGPLALGPARTFLEATLYFEPTLFGMVQFAATVFVAYMVAFATTAQIAILLERGKERFDAQEFSPEARLRLRGLFQGSAMIAASLLCGTASVYSGAANQDHGWWVAGLAPAWILAALLALAFVFFSDWVRNYYTRQSDVDAGAAELRSYLTIRWGWLATRWNRALELALLAQPTDVLERNWLLRLIPVAVETLRPAGFVGPLGVAYSDVTAAIYIAVASLIAFTLAVIWSVETEYTFNTLGTIVVLLLFLSWQLSAAAFILDRFRVPVILVALAAPSALLLIPNTDHWFRMEGARQSGNKTAREMLIAHPRPILIAASGGGIQAAAWMTSVMEQMRATGDFRERVALVSAVSGGSAGAYLLGATWDQKDWTFAREHTRDTSLGRVAWALVGLDLFRPVVVRTGMGDWDRGFVLERDLEHRAAKVSTQVHSLGSWAAAAGKTFPVFLFNATVVETGGPVAFATGEFPSKNFIEHHRNPMTQEHVSISDRLFFETHCQGMPLQDIHAATAARLSASFPYVSPAARPKGKEADCNYHFVDGGYYDNYGLVSLLEWLDDGLEAMSRDEKLALGPVTIVVIRGRVPKPEMPAKTWSFTDQLTAPASAFLAMRSYAQWQGGGAALRLMQEKWAQQMAIKPVLLDYQDLSGTDRPLCADEPMSWKLTPAQKDCIDYQTKRMKIDLP